MLQRKVILTSKKTSVKRIGFESTLCKVAQLGNHPSLITNLQSAKSATFENTKKKKRLKKKFIKLEACNGSIRQMKLNYLGA